jgi:hypothetical protein
MGRNKMPARLGIHLLHSLLGFPDATIHVEVPHWVTPSRFGVLTVEGEELVAEELQLCGITVYVVKSVELPPNTLLEMLDRLTGKLDKVNGASL